MENQHRKITGYRELTEQEVDLMNQIKQQGVNLGDLVNTLQRMSDMDQRWVSIAQTHLQTGLMALTRAVAKPTSF